MTEIVHRAPRAGESITGCCRQSMSDIPRDDRLTNDPTLVSCGRDPQEVRQPDAFDETAAKVVAAHYATVSPWDGDLAGTAFRTAFRILRTHPEAKTLLVDMAIAAGALTFWGSDCTNSCDGNFTSDSMECDTCGSVDTVPLYIITP